MIAVRKLMDGVDDEILARMNIKEEGKFYTMDWRKYGV
jgi:hypothetical protein